MRETWGAGGSVGTFPVGCAVVNTEPSPNAAGSWAVTSGHRGDAPTRKAEEEDSVGKGPALELVPDARQDNGRVWSL